MNRAHNAKQATNCIRIAQENGISNLSIDLIFGYPLLSHEKWERNIEQVLQLGITHVSCYAMTIEPKTALALFISKGKVPPLDDEQSATQYEFLMKKLIESGFEHYEISSFAKPGYKAVHNSNYWNDKAYVGIGPSAHSYIGNTRQWNVTNNALYIQSILNNEVPFEIEALTREQKINEYIMVRLRLKEGISIKKLSTMMNSNELALFIKKVKEYINDNMLILEGDSIQLTMKGKLHADGVSAILFH
jgi:oxygen-independent coproporphyrinogen-3 oxidase